MPHVLVRELPDCLRSILRDVGYGRQDIAVTPKEKGSLFCGGWEGNRGFAILVDMSTGRYERHDGSWGGSNMFNPQNQVDNNTNEYPLPPNGAVINGSEGGRGTFAEITIHPSNAAKLLPAASAEVTEKEKAILVAYRSLKSGPYRKEALAGAGATDADIDALAARGLLKKTKTGVQITTEGKNASR